MHYAFDTWMDREFPGCPFERYADDIVAHCDTEDQARQLRAAIAKRLGTLGLELHPVKTKIVYCKDANRRGDFEHTSFDFLGYTFRGRLAKGQWHLVKQEPASARRQSWSAESAGRSRRAFGFCTGRRGAWSCGRSGGRGALARDCGRR